MSVLNFSDGGRSRAPKGKPVKIILGIGLLSITVALGSTLAANININSGPVEFGQGVAQTVYCGSNAESTLTVTPVSSFVNSANEGDFQLSGVQISNIPSECNGKDFIIKAYSGTEANPLYLAVPYCANPGTSTQSAEVLFDGGRDASDHPGLDVYGDAWGGYSGATGNSDYVTGDGHGYAYVVNDVGIYPSDITATSFVANFDGNRSFGPCGTFALSTDVYKFTIETRDDTWGVDHWRSLDQMPSNTDADFPCGVSGTYHVTSDGILDTNSNCVGAVNIDSSVTSIGPLGLRGSHVTDVIIPNSVTYIEAEAFNSTPSLTSVTIGNGVGIINSYTFADSTNLASVTIVGSTLVRIDHGAFYNTALSSISLPSSVQTISWDVFKWTNIICLDLPLGVAIDPNAFGDIAIPGACSP